MGTLLSFTRQHEFENPEIVSYVQFQRDFDVTPIERFKNGEYN